MCLVCSSRPTKPTSFTVPEQDLLHGLSRWSRRAQEASNPHMHLSSTTRLGSWKSSYYRAPSFADAIIYAEQQSRSQYTTRIPQLSNIFSTNFESLKSYSVCRRTAAFHVHTGHVHSTVTNNNEGVKLNGGAIPSAIMMALTSYSKWRMISLMNSSFSSGSVLKLASTYPS